MNKEKKESSCYADHRCPDCSRTSGTGSVYQASGGGTSEGAGAYVIIDGVLELQYLENRGSAFGMLQNQKVFILFVGIVFLAVLLFFLFKLPEQKKFRIVHVLLAVIVAGGIGNMIDRFRLDYVVDFISFVLINYPIFNVADIYVVVATIGLFILFLFVYKEKDLEFLNFK